MSNGFEQFWKPYTRVFQILCISHYSVFRPNLRKYELKSILLLAYFIVIASSVMFITVVTTRTGSFSREDYVFANDETKFKGSPLMYYINALSIFGSIAIHSAVYLETFFGGKPENEICEKFKLIDDVFTTKLNHTVNYKARNTKYIYFIGIFSLAIALSIACSFSRLPNIYNDKYFMTPLMLIGVLISRIRWLQIALFLNIIADTLDDLQALLKQQQMQSCEESDGSSFNPERIRYIREIYSNVWFVATLMSDCFGWTLITFLIKITLESINGSYWIYINWKLFGSSGLYMRKALHKLCTENISLIYITF